MANAQQPALPSRAPAFLLDHKNWVIKRFDAVKNDPDLLQQGYGIISYAWGKWHNKSKYATSAKPGYPAFDIGNDSSGKPLSWVFPVLNQITSAPGQPVTFSNDEQVTVQEIRAALTFLGKRFIWWDWACIPQGWPNDHVTGLDTTADFWVHPELSGVKWEEVDKMRNFYPASTRGLLWWHQTTWARSVPPVGPVEQVFQAIETIKSKKLNDLDTMDSFAQKLEAARMSEQSLQSLWSFQEGVLFASPQRPHEPPNPAKDAPLEAPSVILDRKGRNLKPQMADDAHAIFRTGQADLGDLNAMTSQFAIQIAGSVLDLGRAKEDKVGGFDVSKSEDKARGVLARLVNTGLVALAYDNPLPLLEARFGRTFEAWNSDEDICVNTLLGPLGIDMATEQKKISATRKAMEEAYTASRKDRAAKAKTTEKDLEKQDKKEVSADILLQQKLAFIAKIFAMYQWRMLLFARGGTRDKASNMNESFWMSLIGKVRPSFAALEVYLGSDKNLAERYGPFANANLPRTLPVLGIDPSSGWLVVQPNANYVFHVFRANDPKQKSKWSACTVYDYVNPKTQPAAGVPVAGTAAATQVKFEDRSKIFGTADVALFPIEVLDTSKSLRNRCVILADYDGTKNSGVFWGIGDFTDLPSVTPSATPDSAKTLENPITIY